MNKNALPKIGSSPRVWGQAFVPFVFSVFGRIIPTRMGTSAQECRLNLNHWDHPHAYGDKWKLENEWDRGIGSSPRVWGQVSVPDALIVANGIIPTRMGTSGNWKMNGIEA